MRSHHKFLSSAAAVLMLVSGSAALSAPPPGHKVPMASHPSGDKGRHEPGMHMHKSEIVHRAHRHHQAELKGDPAELRARAEKHRKLARLYSMSTPVKGVSNYAPLAKHCNALADAYDVAAKEALHAEL